MESAKEEKEDAPVRRIKQYQRRRKSGRGLEKPSAFFDTLNLKFKKSLVIQPPSQLLLPSEEPAHPQLLVPLHEPPPPQLILLSEEPPPQQLLLPSEEPAPPQLLIPLQEPPPPQLLLLSQEPPPSQLLLPSEGPATPQLLIPLQEPPHPQLLLPLQEPPPLQLPLPPQEPPLPPQLPLPSQEPPPLELPPPSLEPPPLELPPPSQEPPPPQLLPPSHEPPPLQLPLPSQESPHRQLPIPSQEPPPPQLTPLPSQLPPPLVPPPPPLPLPSQVPHPLQQQLALQVPPPPVLSAPLPFISRTELPHYRLYDFAKTALIKIFVSPYASVCDLYCGGGSDTDKWNEAQISHFIGVDASSSGISDARETWEGHRKPYTAEFLALDPCLENLEMHLGDKGIPVDIVCCLQHLQLCFDSVERARNLLRNVANLLKPGGYFFGITPDSSTIWTRYQKIVEASHSKAAGAKPIVANCIRSENYTITFETEEEKFPLFGKRYHLKFTNDIASENHSLVHFPSLIRLAREAGLEYIEIQNLTEFYDDNRPQLAGLLFNFGAMFLDPRGKLLPRAFDILGLYTTFVFQKPDPNIAAAVIHEGNATAEEDWSMSNAEHCRGILGPVPSGTRF